MTLLHVWAEPVKGRKVVNSLMIDDSIGTAVEDITFKPEACASILTIPNPSNVEGRSRISIACISSGTRAVAPKKITDLPALFVQPVSWSVPLMVRLLQIEGLIAEAVSALFEIYLT